MGFLYRIIIAAALLLWLLAPSPAAERLPLFDTHVHYSRPDWDVYSPAQILKILGAAGVRRALVSSTPDDGTLKMFSADPQRIVPGLRPYRTRADMSGWARSQDVFEYVSKRIRRAFTKGSGNFTCSTQKTPAPPR